MGSEGLHVISNEVFRSGGDGWAEQAAPLRSSTLEELVNCGFEPSLRNLRAVAVVTTLLVSFLGFGIAAGILGLVSGCSARTISVTRGAHLGTRPAAHSPSGRSDQGPPASPRRVGVPTIFGLFCAVITRWPVAGFFGALGFATLPDKPPKSPSREKPPRALRQWPRGPSCCGTPWRRSAGLAQAIVVTASSAPIPIRPQVGALATRLSNGVSLEAALRIFALEVDDPAADFLVCALLLAATSRAQKLVEVLSSLVDSIREDVSMHLSVDASRASARSSVRTVVLFSLAFACTLAVVAHSYLSPFGTAAGKPSSGLWALLRRWPGAYGSIWSVPPLRSGCWTRSGAR